MYSVCRRYTRLYGYFESELKAHGLTGLKAVGVGSDQSLHMVYDISAFDSRSPDREVCRPGQNWEKAQC